MRVTRAIREYVEEEIHKKYREAEDEIGKEYYEEHQKVVDEITKIMQEASNKARDYAEKLGYVCNYGYRDCGMFHMSGSIDKPEISNEINERRREIRYGADKKIKQVLFDLEMGDTDKAKLKEVLDNIVVD